MALLTTSIVSYRTLPFILLPTLRSLTFSNIQFYQLKSVQILVVIITVKLFSFKVIITTIQNISRLTTRGNIIASFYSTFIKVIVDFDRYTDKIIKIFDFYAGSYKFVLNVLLQTTSVYSYKSRVILIGNLGILLELSGIVGYRSVLTDILNKAYSNLIFIRDTKDTVDLFLKLSKGSENTIGISLTVKILYKYRFYLVLGSSLEVGSYK